MKATNLVDLKAKDLHLYYQYRNNEGLENYFEMLQSFIQASYFDFLKILLREQGIQNSATRYLSFFTLNMLGLYRPLGPSNVGTTYDTEEQYDGNPPITYDSAESYDGTLADAEFKRFLLFLLNYSKPVINIPTFVELVANWCGLRRSDVKLELSLDRILIKIPQTQSSGDFIKLLNVYYNDLGLPFGISLDVRYINSLVSAMTTNPNTELVEDAASSEQPEPAETAETTKNTETTQPTSSSRVLTEAERAEINRLDSEYSELEQRLAAKKAEIQALNGSIPPDNIVAEDRQSGSQWGQATTLTQLLASRPRNNPSWLAVYELERQALINDMCRNRFNRANIGQN